MTAESSPDAARDAAPGLPPLPSIAGAPAAGTATDRGGGVAERAAGEIDPSIDPPRPLPTVTLASWLGGILAAQIAAAYVLTDLCAWTPATRTGIIVGGVISIAGCSIAIGVIKPWRPRPASTWTVLWIGATTIRFLFTPAALFSVYSATFLPGPAVFLGGVAAYLAALAAESVVIARAMLAPAPTCPKRGE